MANEAIEQIQGELELTWRRGKDMPFAVYNYPQAVVFMGKVYIGGGSSDSVRVETSVTQRHTVMVYDPQLDSFDKLPRYTHHEYFSMAVVNNQLVVVGGRDVHAGMVTNKLGVWNEQSETWTDPYPPMTTACNSPSVVVYDNKWLIIVGGFDGRTPLSRVEILDTTGPGQWYLAAPLPQPCDHASTVIIGNTCYVVGGYVAVGVPSRNVYSVCLDDLVLHGQPWTTLPDTPLSYSTALCLNGALMTVGGSRGNTTIYHYQPSTRRWIKAGELPTRREGCACTVLPSGELFVAGGGRINDTSVDIARVKINYVHYTCTLY